MNRKNQSPHTEITKAENGFIVHVSKRFTDFEAEEPTRQGIADRLLSFGIEHLDEILQHASPSPKDASDEQKAARAEKGADLLGRFLASVKANEDPSGEKEHAAPRLGTYVFADFDQAQQFIASLYEATSTEQ